MLSKERQCCVAGCHVALEGHESLKDGRAQVVESHASWVEQLCYQFRFCGELGLNGAFGGPGIYSQECASTPAKRKSHRIDPKLCTREGGNPFFSSRSHAAEKVLDHGIFHLRNPDAG